MMEQLEDACMDLYEEGGAVVKAHEVAEKAGFENTQNVGSALWTDCGPDPSECQFEEIDIRVEGRSNGSNDYRLQKW